MRNFVKTSVPSLLSVALIAGAGYFALKLPALNPPDWTAGDHSHVGGCVVCRLPYYGTPGHASSHGIDPHAGEATPDAPSLTAR